MSLRIERFDAVPVDPAGRSSVYISLPCVDGLLAQIAHLSHELESLSYCAPPDQCHLKIALPFAVCSDTCTLESAAKRSLFKLIKTNTHHLIKKL